jgi:hypothetical protein
MRMAPITVDLPAALLREIGRVIVRYANLEHRLNDVIYLLVDVDPKRGRLAVREPRATDRLEIIRDLVELTQMRITVDLKSVAKILEPVQRKRDQLAHGIWLRDPTTKDIYLRLTRGTWQPIKGQRGKTSRSVTPEGIIFGVDECRELAQSISEAAETIEFLGYEIDAELHASRIPNKQLPKKNLNEDHTRATFRPLLGSPPVRAPSRRKE